MPRRPNTRSPVQFTPVVRPELHRAGDHPREHLQEMIRSGRWRRVHRGVYVAVEPGLDIHAERRGLALGRTFALAETSQAPVIVSHTSAALMRGLPVSRLAAVPHVIQGWHPAGGRDDPTHRHVTSLPEDQRTEQHGVLVTTLERTIVDCVMTLHPADGLVVADAGLHIGADLDRCWAILDAMGPRRGVRRAREVLRLADDGAESPGESWARFHALRIGLPAPTTQVHLITDVGTAWADYGWEEWQLLVEFDGVAKYTARGSATEAVVAERARERAIEQLGYIVIRVVWADVRNPRSFLRVLLGHVPAEVVRALRPRTQLNLP